jgi:hypothetical protein
MFLCQKLKIKFKKRNLWLAPLYTAQKEEPVRLILLMQRENILYMTDTIDVASFLADFYVLYKFASLEYVECAGILITLLITYSSDANLDNM